jgi:hypothetical protein
MRKLRYVFVALLVFGLVLSTAHAARFYTKFEGEDRRGTPTEDMALVYVFRPTFAGGAVSTWTFADEQVIGVSRMRGYYFALVPEGKHVFWIRTMEDISVLELEVAGGETYYLKAGLQARASLEQVGEDQAGIYFETCTYVELTEEGRLRAAYHVENWLAWAHKKADKKNRRNLRIAAREAQSTGGKGEGAVPGETLGSIVLQRDTKSQILLIDQVMFPDCDTRLITNTEVLEVTAEARYVKGRRVAGNWKERWSVDRCGEVIPYEVTYVPDGKGGTQIQLHSLAVTAAAKTAEQFVTWEYHDTSQGAVVFEIVGQEVTFSANEYGPALKPSTWVENIEKFWDQVTLAGDRKRAFMLLRRGRTGESVWYEDVYEFALDQYLKDGEAYKLRQIALRTELDDPSIADIYAASDSGEYLIVSVNYAQIETRGKALSTKWSRSPYVLLTKTGDLKKVKPWMY